MEGIKEAAMYANFEGFTAALVLVQCFLLVIE